MIRNIIWDFDGTLFDTYPAILRSLQAVLSEVGIQVPPNWLRSLARESISHCVSTLSEVYQLTEEEIIAGFQAHYARVPPSEQPPFPGVKAICEHVCTTMGKNVIVTHRGRVSTQALLAANSMTALFAACLTRDDGYPRKPDPAAFEAAMADHGMKREETLAVGDREIDIAAGRAAGILTCSFSPEAEGASADMTVSNYNELLRYLLSESR